MKQTIYKLLTVFITVFSVVNLSFTQTIKEDGEIIKISPEVENRVSMLKDSLTGSWQLLKIIKYEDGDTIVHETSSQLWDSPNAKPETKLRMDSLKNFDIEQNCMKCPYLRWSGKYEIEFRTYKERRYFFLNFKDKRTINTKNNSLKEEEVLEFNGYLSYFENGKMTLIDNDDREWIYKRIDQE